MKTKLLILFIPLLVVGFFTQSFAQFTDEELGERPKWEEFLRTAKITKSDRPWDRREAVTRPWKLTIENDEVVRKAIWKNAKGRMHGYMENWYGEIAAYRLDKYLGLNMVPPTVEKEFKGQRGSCQLWVDYWIKLKEKNEQNIKVVSYKIFHYNRAIYLQRAFDNLIANEDRHSGNIFITKDWRVILPDHSRTFRTSKKFTKKLIYDEKYHEGPRPMKELPRAFVEKLRTLDYDVIKGVVGEYLTDKEIECVLIRRDLIIDWLDKRIEKFGEDKVLY